MSETMVALSADLRRQLEEIAAYAGKPQEEVLREALADYIHRLRRPLPRSIGAGENDSLHGADTEDWLLANWGRE